MKSFLALSFFLLCATQSAMAQFKAGMIPIGGSLNAESQHGENKTDTTSNNEWRLGASPAIGYYYNNHSAIGLTFAYNFQNDDYIYGDTIVNYNHEYGYEIAPFWRYNQILTESFGLFGTLSPSIQYITYGGRGQTKQYSWNYGAAAQVGAYFFPVKNISIETSLTPLHYSYSYSHNPTTNTYQDLSFNLQSSVYSISFFYYFGTGSVL